MEQANKPPAATEYPKPPGKKKVRPWLIGCVADLVLFLFLLCIDVILIAILAPVFSKAASTTNTGIRWVDGDPEPGEVGIRNLGESTYTLT